MVPGIRCLKAFPQRANLHRQFEKNGMGRICMTEIDRRTALSTAATLAAGAMTSTILAQDARAQGGATAPQAAALTGVKALVYDVFGTVVDWRNGVARDAERILKPLGYSLNWIEFADAWRALYQPTMEEVRSGRRP